MPIKYLVITLLFYFFAVLQNSFFVHFNILGTAPNFVFILFFILIFFSPHKGLYSWEDLFYSVIAGFFLDVFYYSYFGVSFVLLSIIAVIIKKLLSSLKQRKDKYSIVYFIPLFFIFFVIYSVLSGIYFYFFSVSGSSIVSYVIGWIFLVKIIYNCIFAVIGFYIYKNLWVRAHSLYRQ